MTIFKGNFTPIEIENANKEFNRIIDSLKSNKIFNSYFSDLDIKGKTKTIIGFDNLDEETPGETTRNNNNGDRYIFLNSSIYYEIKKVFTKLVNNKKNLSGKDVLYINIFVHEYLHNRQTYLFTLKGFSRNLSEGLTEIIAQKYTNNFLEAYCGKSFEKVLNKSFIYKDIVGIIKPLLEKFNILQFNKLDKFIYKDIESMLCRINHNNIREEFVVIMNGYDKKLSALTMVNLKRKLDYRYK